MEGTCLSKAGTKTETIIRELLCEDVQNNCWLGLCDFCSREENVNQLFTEIEDDDDVAFYQ